MRFFYLLALILIMANTGCKTSTSYYYNLDGITDDTLPIAKIKSNTETDASMDLKERGIFKHNAKSQSTVGKIAEAAVAASTARAINK